MFELLGNAYIQTILWMMSGVGAFQILIYISRGFNTGDLSAAVVHLTGGRFK